MIPYTEFKKNVYTRAYELQATYGWRLGQAVFNLLDLPENGRIAREVAELDGVDCYYDDRNIKQFIGSCWKRHYDRPSGAKANSGEPKYFNPSTKLIIYEIL